MKYLSFLLFFAASLFVGILISGCKDSTTSINGTPGDIIGTIFGVEDTLYHSIPDRSGVKVSLDGTPYSTLTDSFGRWQLTTIPAGTYTIIFSKENYVQHTRQNFIFGGNGTYHYDLDYNNPVLMQPLPNLFPNIVLRPFVDFIQINYRDSNWVDSSGYHTINLDDTEIIKSDIAILSSRSQSMYHGQQVSGAIFFGPSENIDPSVPTSYSYYNIHNNFPDSSGICNFTIHRSWFLQLGFTSGSTIYCCAFAHVNNLDQWLDSKTNSYAYSGFSPHHSEVKSFILP